MVKVPRKPEAKIRDGKPLEKGNLRKLWISPFYVENGQQDIHIPEGPSEGENRG